MEPMKKCTKCRRWLPLTSFFRRTASKDGLMPICKECDRIRSATYHADNREEARKQRAEHYATHRVRILAASKVYRDSNREKISQQRIPYRLAHKADKAEYDRAYNAARAEENVRQATEWRKTHPSARKAQKMKRRAIKLGSIVEPLPNDYETGLYETQHGLCYYCGRDLETTGFHRDHMTPLVREGAHSLENLCLACPACNMRKSTKTAEEFMAVLQGGES